VVHHGERAGRVLQDSPGNQSEEQAAEGAPSMSADDEELCIGTGLHQDAAWLAELDDQLYPDVRIFVSPARYRRCQ
jgi:hypothetical protein